MGMSRRKAIDAELDALNAAASVWDENAENVVFAAAMSETGESKQRVYRDVMARAMQAEFSNPNPILNAVLNAKKPLDYDTRNQELIVDGQRISQKLLEESGARQAMEKVYRDAVVRGVGVSYVRPDGVIEEPVKPKKTALRDYVELDL